MPDRNLGAIRLLKTLDIEEQRNNVFGKPLIGWKKTSEGQDGFINPNGWALLRTVVQKSVKEKLEDLYDQFIMVENPGSVVIATAGEGDDAKVGLVQNYRFVGERFGFGVDNPSKYVAGLDQKQLWSALLETLGQKCWEAPRGLIPPSEKPEELNAFVLKTAKLEAAQEAGFTVEESKIAGRSNANSTFFAHAQYVVTAKIVSQGERKPENEEMIGGVHLFSKQELRQMVEQGEFVDGMALSAMAVAGFHF